MNRRIGVVGDGAAGALVVVGLLREATRRGTALEVVWVGDGEPARGVAYSTPHPWHRLNVPAGSMSLGEASGTFPQWLAARGLDDDVFAPRHAFGDYLAETLREARAAAGPAVRLDRHDDRVVGIERDQQEVRLVRRAGPPVTVDRAVLAVGPLPSPALPGGSALIAHPRIVADPWGADLDPGPDEQVLLVGTGLTMVDVALTLARRAPSVRLHAVSRGGLLPRAHDPDQEGAADPVAHPDDGLDLDGLVARVEAAVAARGGRWREVVDGLRPVTPGLWQALSFEDRQRFRAEQARRWETHRHRMAPSVAREVEGLQRAGTLQVHAGGVESVVEADDGTDRLLARIADPGVELVVERVVSCTGAQDDVTATDDPLVRSLLDAGLARPHPTGLGFDTGPHGALAPGLFTLGTPRRGELYETTSVPEIREQAADLVDRLLDATS